MTHVGDLVQIVAFAAQTVMEQAALPTPFGFAAAFAELIFPIGRPAFHFEKRTPRRRTEEMQVIGHEQVVADPPSRGVILPDVVQQMHHIGLSTPVAAMVGANRTPEEGLAIESGQHALRRGVPSKGAWFVRIGWR